MKNKIFIIITSFFITFPALHSENTDKEFILSAMTYPEAEILTGSLLNYPFFALDLQKRKPDYDMIKKMIKRKDKAIGENPGAEDLYNLGNLYKEIHDYKNAVKKYKLSLKAFDFAGTNNPGIYKEVVIKGYLYFYLAETDYKSDRTGYLEKSSGFLKAAIELKPGKDLWIKLGDCYLALNRLNEALYCYNHVPEEKKIYHIYTRLQSVSFQADYLKLIEDLSWPKLRNLPVAHLTDFENIETAINNSTGRDKIIMKVQQYVYLLRLLLLKNEAFRIEKSIANNISVNIFTDDENVILNDAEKYLKSEGEKNLRPASYEYLMGIICYLKSDYRKAFLFFEDSLKKNEYPEFIYKDLLSASGKINDDTVIKKIINNKISKYPDASDYLILGSIEFKKNNLKNAEMLCNQALKINYNYPEAFSGLGIIYAREGNYFAADEMVKKGNYLLRDKQSGKMLKSQMIVNEAAVALLKNEKERAYILLRLVLTADNNEKAGKLYNRFFKQNEKVQN